VGQNRSYTSASFRTSRMSRNDVLRSSFHSIRQHCLSDFVIRAMPLSETLSARRTPSIASSHWAEDKLFGSRRAHTISLLWDQEHKLCCPAPLPLEFPDTRRPASLAVHTLSFSFTRPLLVQSSYCSKRVMNFFMQPQQESSLTSAR
jgi:hypothetical protein